MTIHSGKNRKKDQVRVVGRWQSIPVAMLRDTRLKTNERMLCSLLYTFQGNDEYSYPLQRSLGELMGVDERSVQRWLNVLKSYGYVHITRTLRGNIYVLNEPSPILTNTTQGSYPHPTQGSPDTTQESDADTIPESDASFTKNHPRLESPTPPPPTPEGDDDDSHDSIQENESEIGDYLRNEIKIVVLKELATKLRNVPFSLIQERVAKLIDQGKTQGIIVKSLRDVPFTPGQMSEHGPLPTDRAYWQSHGFTFGGDEPTDLEKLLDLSDPDLKAYF